MSGEARGLLLRLAAPAVAIVVVLVVARVRRLSLRADLGWRWPPARQALPWLAAFIALAVMEEVAYRALGLGAGTGWRGRYPPAGIALRVVGMVGLAPVAEELVFRGILYWRLSHTRLGRAGAVLVTSAAFAALHGQYDAAGMAMVLADGLFLGAARAATGSMLLPMACHVLGNLYAAAQRVAG